MFGAKLAVAVGLDDGSDTTLLVGRGAVLTVTRCGDGATLIEIDEGAGVDEAAVMTNSINIVALAAAPTISCWRRLRVRQNPATWAIA